MYKVQLVIPCLLVLSSSGSFAMDDRELTPEFASCMDKSAGVTSEMINCISRETKHQDLRLNNNYKLLMSMLSAARRSELIAAQRTWIAFRDANCRFYFDPDGGTISRVAASGCYMSMTADRAKELRQLDTDN